jgi:GMP synthase PP-ATPase subunit
MTDNTKHTPTPADLKELVIVRLQTMAGDKRVSVGADGEEYSKYDLIRHVEADDDIGKKFVELDMAFLRAIKDGVLLDEMLKTV